MVELNFKSMQYNYVGKSTETKPVTNVPDATTFYEVDTKQMFIFYEGEWFPMK